MEPNTDDQIEVRRIVDIRNMSDVELEHEGWTARRGSWPPVIDLESGTLLYPSMDPEGNGPGTLFGIDPNNETCFLST